MTSGPEPYFWDRWMVWQDGEYTIDPEAPERVKKDYEEWEANTGMLEPEPLPSVEEMLASGDGD